MAPYHTGSQLTTASTQLPHLLKLLDDESPPVRNAVLEQFMSLGTALADEIKNQDITLTTGQQTVLQPLLDDQAREWLKTVWLSWLRIRGDKERLESGLAGR